MPTRDSYKHGEFCWVDLVAHDMAAAKTFYEQLFGWTCEDQDTQGGPPYAIFSVGGKSVAGMGQMCDEMKSQGIPPMWNSYVNVDDVDAIAKKSEELGGKVTMPPMTVLDAGRMAFIQDPTGGNVAFWQKINHIGAQLVTEPGAFCWNELATRDAAAAKQFFGELLGWEFADNPHAPTPYFMIHVDGQGNGGIMQMNEQWGNIPPHWSVYFSVADVDATVGKVQELGGKVIVPPFQIPVGRLAVLGDPQGAHFSVIALSQAPPQ